MCGIFGIVDPDASARDRADRLLAALFRLSESRGKEAAGLAGVTGDRIRVLKSPVPSSRLMRTRVYADYVAQVVRAPRALAVVGHSRLVTNGSQAEQANNQPVCVDGIVGVHNGIIVNEASLWRAHPDLPRTGDVDTEVLFRLIRRFATRDG